MDEGWQLWEVFVRTHHSMAHRHVGSILAVDTAMAIQNARDVYARMGDEASIWVVPSRHIAAADPAEHAALFAAAADKTFRHASFYDVPDQLDHL